MKALVKSRAEAGLWLEDVPEPRVGISDVKIVYRVKKAIKVLDARTGALTPLAVAKASPIGLGIEGRRVAWAENVNGRGRIMSLISA